MRALRWLTAALAACFVAVFLANAYGSPARARARASAPPLAPASELAGDPLALEGEGAQLLFGEEQHAAQREARRMAPAVIAEREASRTRFEGLTGASAAQLAAKAFPSVVGQQAGAPPLASGERITGYPSTHAASLLLPGGRHGVVESTQPMAIETSASKLIPIDLQPRAVAGGFVPRTNQVGVHIPSRLAQGVSLPSLGVSLTPLTERGQAVAGSAGHLDGAAVFYGSTAADTDTLVKPTVSGFEEDTLLRSAASPEQLDFKIGLPGGARLVRGRDGMVRVTAGGQAIATIPTPSAQDAEGTNVPVTVGVSGDVLRLAVERRGASAYRYPIEVDPTVEDKMAGFEQERKNWASWTSDPSVIKFHEGDIEHGEYNVPYPASQGARDIYVTQKESHIYEFYVEGYRVSGTKAVETRMGVRYNAHAGEWMKTLPANGESKPEQVCAENACEARQVNGTNDEDAAVFELNTLEESRETFSSSFTNPIVYIDQEKGPSASVDTSDQTLNGRSNAATGQWVRTVARPSAVFGVNAFDPGVGIDRVGIKSPNSSSWGHSAVESPENECAPGSGHYEWWERNESESHLVQCNECYETTCITQAKGRPLAIPFEALGELPEGEDTVEATVRDAVGLTATVKGTIHVDNAPPHNVTLTGLPSELAAGEFHPKAEATDEKSGIKSIALYIDGKEVPSAGGSCPSGPCTGKTEWTISGGNYAAGTHVAAVIATDNAGNASAPTEVTFKVGATSKTSLGPGTVNLASGEYTVSATDVSMGDGLTVGRVYNSAHLGSSFPLGRSWSLTLGGHQSLSVEPNGSVVLFNGGSETIFAKKGTAYESPSGNSNLTLASAENKGVPEYILKDEATNTSTTFIDVSEEGNEWVPTIQQGAVATNTVTYLYDTETYSRKKTGLIGPGAFPKEILAPVPAGVSCSPELKPGCRALTFVYGGHGSPGENESGWGEVWPYLKEIVYCAYNPVTKEMQKTTVANYLYDGQGRIRAEWDPRVSPALKTKYGYGSEGRLTALTPPGQESWAFTYGTIPSDKAHQRILKVAQAPTSAGLWGGSSPVNTEAPKISGTPVIGSMLSVSYGSWSGSPVAYGYQWKDCNTSGGECSLIAGATNQNYTVAASDVGHTIVAEVSAINGGGTVSSNSTATVVVLPQITEYGETSGSHPFDITAGVNVNGGSNLWYTDAGTGKVVPMSTTGGNEAEYPTENSEPEGIVKGPDGNMWFVEHAFRNVVRISPSGAESFRTLSRFGTYNVGIAVGPDNNLWFTESESNYIGKVNTATEVLAEYALPAGSSPRGIAAGQSGNLWFTNYGTSKIGEITTSGTITEYALPAGSEPTSIVADPIEGYLWFTEYGTGKIGMMSPSGTIVAEYQLPAGSRPQEIAYGPDGELWFTESGTAKIGRITYGGAITEYPLPSGSNPYGITAGPDGNIWFTDYGTNKVGRITVVTSQGESHNPEPGYTVEYNVPLSGTELPTMTESEVKTWGQSDDPVQASAIFEPDRAQGWPASGYSGSTLYYLDRKGEIVNVKSRAGGISTTEYNATNDVVRTLSPDNREAALKEGAKSAEAAKLLDSESTYNAEGTELESTLGPRRLVKLDNGKEVQARTHTVYTYDQGQPTEGGPYRLPTEVKQGAQTETEGEQDVRTVKTSYSGQGNLGWKLRKPTSVTKDPSGLALTETFAYEEATGNVVEAKTPKGSKTTVGSPTFDWAKGTLGSGNGQLHAPKGDAINAKDEVFVADEENNRIEVFNSNGEYARTIGSLGSGNGQLKEPRAVALDSKGNVWVADTANNRIEEFTEAGSFVRTAGSGGSGPGQFKEPRGIAVDSHNNVWVSDMYNDRIEEFNEEGKYLKTVGSAGSGNGQLNWPRGLVVGANGLVWVTDEKNNRVEVFKENGEFDMILGTAGTGNGQFKEPKGITLALGLVWVVDTENNRVQAFTEQGAYQLQFGSYGTGNGQFHEPHGIAIDPRGNVYIVDAENNRLQKWEVPVSDEADDTQTIYYSTASNPSYPSCGGHPEWANLPCRVQPAKQPETAGLPALPVTTYTYNVWGEPETIVSAAGSTTRTTTNTYDPAGRRLSSSLSSSVGTVLPTVNYKYNEANGAIAEQSTTTSGKTQSIADSFNTLGQVISYTDANGTVSTYEYQKEGAYRLKSINDGKGIQTFTYNVNGEVYTIKDTAATKFTLRAAYDPEGNLLTQSYPNGMTATYSYNQVGMPINLEYQKTSYCTEKCVWFKDAVVPTINGQWAVQTSTQATNRYTYDNVGRLIQVQDEPAGKGCTTRVYSLDEETNRLGLTTRAPESNGSCAATGGSAETHSYDQANRLLDSGIAYDTFGDITKLPASDAGGSALESSFFVDGQLASQTQAGETIGYSLDPAGRVSETVATGKVVATTVNHYEGASQEPSWTSEPSGSTSRDVPGFTGLVATQFNTESPVLQIANLHGDIVATASMSETATGPASTVAEASEYGVPGTEAPPKYSWLGAHELPTQLPSGVVTMGARSYVPQMGRFLQTDPIPGGSANAYTYTYGDPMGSTDLSGEYTLTLNKYWEEAGNEYWTLASERRAAENAAAQAEAEREEAQANAEWYWQTALEGLEGEEWEEEGEEWEYVSYKQTSGEASSAPLTSGLSWQPFDEGQEEESGRQAASGIMQCQVGHLGSCIRMAAARCSRHGMCHGNSNGQPIRNTSATCNRGSSSCHGGGNGPPRRESRAEQIWREVGERARRAGEAQDHGGFPDGEGLGDK